MAGTPIAISVLADVKDANRNLASINANLKGLGEQATRTGDFVKRGMGIAAGAFAGAQVVQGIKEAVGAAAELQDTVGAIGVVFGDAGDEVAAWGEQAAASMGLSTNEALKAAQSFGVFAKSAGLAGEQAASFSEQTAQLAGDLASFFGGSVSDAVTAMGAALRGEFEPIRRYGVLLDDATLRAKALEMGLVSTTKNALTPQVRVLAAHAAILEQTKDAQGDYARTADQTSNTLRTLSAEWSNLTTDLAANTLPTVTNVAKAGLKLLQMYEAIPGPVKAAGAALVGLTVVRKLGVAAAVREQVAALALGDTWRYVSVQAVAAGRTQAGVFSRSLAFTKTVGAGIGTVGRATAGLVGFTGAMYGLDAAIANIDDQLPTVDRLTAALSDLRGSMTLTQGAVSSASTGIVDLAQAIDTLASPNAVEKVNQFAVGIANIFGVDLDSRVSASRKVLEQYDQAFAAMVGSGNVEQAQRQFAVLRQEWLEQGGTLDELRAAFPAYVDALGEASGGASGAASAAGELNGQLDYQAGVLARVKRAQQELTTALKTYDRVLSRREAQQALRDDLAADTKEFHKSRDAANKWALDFQRDVATRSSSIKDDAKQAAFLGRSYREAFKKLTDSGLTPRQARQLLKPLRDLKGDAKKSANDVVKAYKGTLAAQHQSIEDQVARSFGYPASGHGLAADWRQAGLDSAQGFAGGLTSGQSDVDAAAARLGFTAVASARTALDSHSPSRKFRKIGLDATDGFAKGVDDGAGTVDASMKRLTTSMADRLRDSTDKLRELKDEAKQYADDIKDSFTSLADVTELPAGNIFGITRGLHQQLKDAKAFAANIKKLAKSGLNQTTLDQLLAAGVEGGSTAAATLAANRGAIGRVNDLVGRIERVGGRAGRRGADTKFGDDIAAQRGRVQSIRNDYHIAKVVINNPKPERGSDSITTGLRKKAYLMGAA